MGIRRGNKDVTDLLAKLAESLGKDLARWRRPSCYLYFFLSFKCPAKCPDIASECSCRIAAVVRAPVMHSGVKVCDGGASEAAAESQGLKGNEKEGGEGQPL
jgi:hypothetical protein